MADVDVRETPTAGRLVFLSYAREDRPIAESVRRWLLDSGLRCWMDDQRVPEGATLEIVGTSIWDGLHSATDFVALVTNNSHRKPWVVHEWNTAAARWLASGQPRIHVIVDGRASQVPELPYTSMIRLDDTERTVADQLYRQLAGAPPTTDKDWAREVTDLRERYLMGGATATSAVHAFDALSPALARRLDAACAAGFKGEHSATILWLRKLAKLLDLRIRPTTLAAWLEAASAACSDPQERNLLLNNLGTTLGYIGDYSRAAHHLEAAATGCAEVGDASGVAMAHANLALAAIDDGDVDEADRALQVARTSLRVAYEQTSLTTAAVTVGEVMTTDANLACHAGVLLTRRGRHDEALTYFGRSLACAEAIESRRGVAIALGRMAWSDLQRGRAELATSLQLQRYMGISVATFNPRGTATAHHWLGELAVLRGQLTEAVLHFREEALLRSWLGNANESFRARACATLAARAAGVELDMHLSPGPSAHDPTDEALAVMLASGQVPQPLHELGAPLRRLIAVATAGRPT